MRSYPPPLCPVITSEQVNLTTPYDEDRAGDIRAFLRDKGGKFTRIDIPGAMGASATRINERGQIVGIYSETSPDTQVATDTRGFRFDGGEVTQIDVPGAVRTQPLGINNHSQIVDEYYDAAGNIHGFLRDSSGHFTTIDIPGAATTSLFGINDRGQTVGAYAGADGISYGFLWDNGAFTTIDAPGATSFTSYNPLGEGGKTRFANNGNNMEDDIHAP